MATGATITLLDSVIKKYIDSEFQEGYDDHFPVLRDAIKHTPGKHQGNTVQFPSLIHNDEVRDATSEGSNVGAEEYKTSGVKATLAKYGKKTEPTIESMGVSLEGFAKRMSGAITRQAKRSMEVLTIDAMGYGAAAIRADRDANYESLAFATDVGAATTANVFTSTSLVAVDDQYNSGRCAVISGSGQGQCRTVHDYTGATGIVDTGNSGVMAPFNEALDFTTEKDEPNTQDSYSLVSSPKGLSSSDILSSDVISRGQFFHENHFNTEPNDGANDWVLYLTPFGRRDLYDHDQSFRRVMENYRGEFFDNPDNSMAHYLNTTIKKINKGFRCGNGGATGDAAYSATGSVHFFPLCGKDSHYITDIKLWDKSKSPGALTFFTVTRPDSNNPDLAYIVMGWVMYFAAIPTFCTRIVNLMCGTSQS